MKHAKTTGGEEGGDEEGGEEGEEEEEKEEEVQYNLEDENKGGWTKLMKRMKGIPLLGIILAFLSALLFAFCNVIVQKVNKRFKLMYKIPNSSKI